jgi:ribonucleoside-diphosphate reductase beta chain
LIKELENAFDEEGSFAAVEQKYGFKGNQLEMPKENLLKGVGEIIAYSVRDEHLHSTAGCFIFNQLRQEFPELHNARLNDSIYEAATVAVSLEDNFTDMVFNNHKLDGLNAEMVKAFVRTRANAKLNELSLEAIFTPDVEQAKEIERWFYLMTGGESCTDFFAARVSNYAKGAFKPDLIDWDVVFA